MQIIGVSLNVLNGGHLSPVGFFGSFKREFGLHAAGAGSNRQTPTDFVNE